MHTGTSVALWNEEGCSGSCTTALGLCSGWQLSNFPGLTATHAGRDISPAVSWRAFHLALKEGNVPSVVRELEDCVSDS